MSTACSTKAPLEVLMVMYEGFPFSWKMILFPLAVLLYLELMRRLERYWASRRPLSEEERLWLHARQQGISEYEVFRRAAAEWSMAPQRADADFKTYLTRQAMPHYVRDYIRKY
jgi:hypothetical protein